MKHPPRLMVLQWLTVLVPAVCAGLYETVRHTLLANDLPDGVGTLLAVALVLGISLAFARVSFSIIRHMEARLLERNRRLEELSRRVERLAVIEERDRLAREMHDGIAQVLAYLMIRLDTIGTLVQRGRGEEAAREVRLLRASSEEAYAEVREAIAGLRTRPAAGAVGLAAALQEYTAQFTDRTQIPATCSIGDVALSDEELPIAAELHLMRIAQEALANVRKHARATQVMVRFWPDSAGWHLSVQDDGSGFDPKSVLQRDRSPGSGEAKHQPVGLAIMRERAGILGGTLTVESSTTGTTVRADVPYGGELSTSHEKGNTDGAIRRPSHGGPGDQGGWEPAGRGAATTEAASPAS